MVKILVDFPEEMHTDLVNLVDKIGLSKSDAIRYAVSNLTSPHYN